MCVSEYKIICAGLCVKKAGSLGPITNSSDLQSYRTKRLWKKRSSLATTWNVMLRVSPFQDKQLSASVIHSGLEGW